MRLIHGVLCLTLSSGLAGSVAAYRAAAGDVTPAPLPADGSAQTTWAPCRPGARLERGACVVDVVRTVTVPATDPPVVVPPSPRGAEDADDEGHGEGHGEGDGDDD